MTLNTEYNEEFRYVPRSPREVVEAEVEDLILMGVLRQGEACSESVLAEHLANERIASHRPNTTIKRTERRFAIEWLERMGLIPRLQAKVKSMLIEVTTSIVEEWTETRVALEVVNVEKLLALALHADDLERIVINLEAHVHRANNIDVSNPRNLRRYFAADRDFHRTIAVEAGRKQTWDDYLESIILKKIFFVYSQAELTAIADSKQSIIEQHRKIINAIRTRDVDEARHAMKGHILASTKNWQQRKIVKQ